MEAYLKDNKCFKYGENGVCLCLKRNERCDPPRALTVQAPKEVEFQCLMHGVRLENTML